MTTTVTINPTELELQPFSNQPQNEDISAHHHRVSTDREAVKSPDIPHDTSNAIISPEAPTLSKLQQVLTILQPCAINFFGSFSSGIITVGLPTIASSIVLPRSLYLWPSSVYNLTSGAALLIAGSVADIIGSRRVEVAGIFLLGIFILACGFAQTGIQLIMFRAMQGIALAMHIPASVSIISTSIPAGRARNIGFSCLGLSQPLGFSFGMVTSGIMIEKIGWRAGFYISGAAIVVAAACSWATLPKPATKTEASTLLVQLKKLCRDIDWIGATIASAGLALLSYVLAMVSADLLAIRSATVAALLATSLALLLAFPFWMHRRERRGKSALIPNSLWKNARFSSICAVVALSYGANNAMTQFSSLYFQEIQHHAALTASLYTLPNLLVGVSINLSIGLFIDRLPAGLLVISSSLLSALAPLLMALVDPNWAYHRLELWAQILAPLNADVLYTVGLIIVSDGFPAHTQGLAGAVFGTVAMFGTSLGVGMCQVVGLGVMEKEGGGEGGLLGNYRAAFWTMFALTLCCILVAVLGLRKTGKVGLKKE